MSVTLNATVCSPTANSLATVAEADAYFANIYGRADWATLGNDAKAQLLITATTHIEMQSFVGRKIMERYSDVGQEQALSFPRWSQGRQRHGYCPFTCAPASTATSIIGTALANLTYLPDDYFNYGSVVITGGALQGQARSVSDFASATGTLTVATFGAAPGEVSAVAIDPITDDIKWACFEQAWYIYQVGDPNASRDAMNQGLVEMSIEGALRQVFRGRAQGTGASPGVLGSACRDLLVASQWLSTGISLVAGD